MTELSEREIAGLLDDLGTKTRAAAPRPGPDLMARVLADASDAMPQAEATAPARATRSGGWIGLMDRIWNWENGAMAAMALCLAVGIGVGMETDLSVLALQSTAEADTLAALDLPFAEDLL